MAIKRLVYRVINSNEYVCCCIFTIRRQQPMRIARAVTLDLKQREQLEQRARARSLPARVVERARIVLRPAEGMQDKEIAREFSITREKSARWRNRFLEGGLAALEKDAQRPGRAPTITPARVRGVLDK